MMMPLVFLGVFLAFQVVNARNHFDLVESGNGKMILNYNVTLGTNETFCLNVSSYAINGISPSATVSLISTNTVHKLYDASFTFFPSRQVIGGVSGFRIYKNSNVIARFPEPEWSRQYPFCKSTVLDVPTLEPFNEICIGNTCGAGRCLRDDFNNFWGQIQIDGYETNDFLTRDPVASICGEQTVGEVQYVAWTHRGEMVFNFQVTVNQSGVPLPQELVTYLNRRQPVAVSVNFTAANRANLSNFAVAFLYPDETSQSFVNWPFSGIEADDSTCYGATIQAPDFKAGWNRVVIGSSCEGPYCGLETYTGSLIVHGHWTDADVDWVGTIDQSCYTVINTPTYAPTKDPPVTRGDVAAIILVSTIGSVIFVFAVWACVVGFRRLKRRYIVSDGKELNDPGCTWAGW